MTWIYISYIEFSFGICPFYWDGWFYTIWDVILVLASPNWCAEAKNLIYTLWVRFFSVVTKFQAQNHKSQWFHNIYPKPIFVAETRNMTDCHKSVITKQNLSMDANNLFSHLQSGTRLASKTFFLIYIFKFH